MLMLLLLLLPATPAAPTLNAVDPTCTVATGTITVTSATAGLTFSLDGGAFGPYPAGGYTGLTSGPHTNYCTKCSRLYHFSDNVAVAAAPGAPGSCQH